MVRAFGWQLAPVLRALKDPPIVLHFLRGYCVSDTSRDFTQHVHCHANQWTLSPSYILGKKSMDFIHRLPHGHNLVLGQPGKAQASSSWPLSLHTFVNRYSRNVGTLGMLPCILCRCFHGLSFSVGDRYCHLSNTRGT